MDTCEACGHHIEEHDLTLGCGRFVHDASGMLVVCGCTAESGDD